MMNATYSPEDNKLRLYADGRLGAELYARVRGAGFIWAPKQELFVAPASNCERWLAHLENRLLYERAMLAESGGLKSDAFDFQVGGQVLVSGVWSTIVRVTRKDGKAVSVTTNARFCRVKPVESIGDYRAPSVEAAAKAKAATKLPKLCNYDAPGFVHITQAQWNAKHGDYKGSHVIEATEELGRHRLRTAQTFGT